MPIGICDLRGPADDTIAEAELASNLGYDSFWSNENLSYKDGVTDAAALTNIEDIDIVVGVLSPFIRHPVHIATLAHSIDDFAGGDLKGIALGAGFSGEFQRKLGIDTSRPVKRLSEAYDIIKSIMEDGTCNYDGDIYEINNWKFRNEFEREIPIFLTAIGPKMREMAMYKFDGMYIPWPSVEYAEWVTEEMEDTLTEFGRGRDEFPLVSNIATAVTSEDSELSYEEQTRDLREVAALHLCSDHFEEIVGRGGADYDIEKLRQAMREGDWDTVFDIVDQDILDVFTVMGPPDKCREKVEALLDTGIDYPVYINYGPRETKLRSVKELAPSKLDSSID